MSAAETPMERGEPHPRAAAKAFRDAQSAMLAEMQRKAWAEPCAYCGHRSDKHCLYSSDMRECEVTECKCFAFVASAEVSR